MLKALQIHTQASSGNISGDKDRFFRFSLPIPGLGYSFLTLTLISFRMNAGGLLRKKRNLLKNTYIHSLTRFTYGIAIMAKITSQKISSSLIVYKYQYLYVFGLMTL